MRERLRVLVADVLDIAPPALPDDAEISWPEEWDSVSHIQIMLAIEQEFAIELTADEMLEAKSLTTIEAFLYERAGQSS